MWNFLSFQETKARASKSSAEIAFNSSPTCTITDLLYTHSPKQWADAHPAEAHPVIQEATQELSKCTRGGTFRHAFK